MIYWKWWTGRLEGKEASFVAGAVLGRQVPQVHMIIDMEDGREGIAIQQNSPRSIQHKNSPRLLQITVEIRRRDRRDGAKQKRRVAPLLAAPPLAPQI